MKIQRNSWDCGPISIINALRAIGVRVTEREVKLHTGTTKKEGTNEHGLKSALTRLIGYAGDEFTASKADAYEILHAAVLDGSPVLLAVDSERHWVVAVGVVGDRVIVMDSWNSAANKSECGIEVYDRKRLLKWWVGGGTYYGLVVRRA